MSTAEVLLVSVIGLLVLFGAFLTWNTAFAQEDSVSDRVDALDRVDLAFDRLQDDVREAHGITVGSGGTTLTLSLARAASGVVAFVPTRWDCSTVDAATSLRTCTRTQGTAAAETVLTGVSTASTLFTAVSGASHPGVRADLVVQTGEKGRPVALKSLLSSRVCQTASTTSC